MVPLIHFSKSRRLKWKSTAVTFIVFIFLQKSARADCKLSAIFANTGEKEERLIVGNSSQNL